MSKRTRRNDSDDDEELDEFDFLFAQARRSALDPVPRGPKRRGRPKLHAKQNSTISAPLTGVPIVPKEEEKPQEPAVPRRGRGRPRKYPRKDEVETKAQAPEPEPEIKEAEKEPNNNEEIVDKMDVEEPQEKEVEKPHEELKSLELEVDKVVDDEKEKEEPEAKEEEKIPEIEIKEEPMVEEMKIEEPTVTGPALTPSLEFDPRFLETNDYIVLEDTMKKLLEREAQMQRELTVVEAAQKAALSNPRAFYEDLQASKVRLPPWPAKAKPIVLPTIIYDQYPKKKVEDKTENVEEKKKESKDGRILWTVEEQQLFEKLLVKYPFNSNESDSLRYEQIAMHIPGKTVRQVQARSSKYFERLYLAGLPVPGRVPNHVVVQQKILQKQREDNKKERELRAKAAFDDSDDMDQVPLPPPIDLPKKSKNLTSDLDYYEPPKMVIPDGPSSIELRPNVEKIVPLHKRVRSDANDLVHLGYKCDCCGVEPIKGPRWFCNDCPEDNQVDLCKDCAKKSFPHPRHKPSHKMGRIEYAEAPYFEGDNSEDDIEAQYGYLDANFMPS